MVQDPKVDRKEWTRDLGPEVVLEVCHLNRWRMESEGSSLREQVVIKRSDGVGEGRDGDHSRLAAKGNERTQDHVVLSGRIMEACQGIAGLWPPAWVHRQGKAFKRRSGRGQRNESNREFQFQRAWHIRQASKRNHAKRSKAEGESSELGHQVGAELWKPWDKNWEKRSELD